MDENKKAVVDRYKDEVSELFRKHSNANTIPAYQRARREAVLDLVIRAFNEGSASYPLVDEDSEPSVVRVKKPSWCPGAIWLAYKRLIIRDINSAQLQLFKGQEDAVVTLRFTTDEESFYKEVRDQFLKVGKYSWWCQCECTQTHDSLGTKTKSGFYPKTYELRAKASLGDPACAEAFRKEESTDQ